MAARLLVLILALGLALPAAAQSRDETLADIRQELSVLFVEIQKLKRELSTTGAPNTPQLGGSALQRIDSIEQEVQRLTAQIEEMEFRIQKIVEDGTRRIGDLEFRLVELEGGDVSELGETTTLGGADIAAAPAPAPAVPPESAGGVELAVGERADFDAAKAAFEAGDTAQAADLFAAFTETYPGSPLSGEAHFLRGEALSAEGATSAAARAYLESFSGSPSGDRAPQSLLKLGLALDALGQTREACVTLGEVGTRFPEAAEAQEADAAMDSIGCN
ncbi:tol-pal system protein YbgF [Rhodovulum sp. ES.010]|uniref:tol-pal system protein YbgF n=1 Tax=Rhodovulum sp. ES.010 TaxID=1882821 RepID=UPI000926FF20|nr:tol-pal system protein YbgF [Rhodovulum sp. ES.010]SIO56347.1 tol-pal system protein YbgF [Rhodovulum sp. ES.010]